MITGAGLGNLNSRILALLQRGREKTQVPKDKKARVFIRCWGTYGSKNFGQSVQERNRQETTWDSKRLEQCDLKLDRKKAIVSVRFARECKIKKNEEECS